MKFTLFPRVIGHASVRISREGTKLLLPDLFDQATFAPGAAFVCIRPDGSPTCLPWPQLDRTFWERLSVPFGTERAIILTASVRIAGTWLAATAGEARSARGTIDEWEVWPLEEWAGPALPLRDEKWGALGFDAPDAGGTSPQPGRVRMMPPSAQRKDEEAPRIEAARIRIITGGPWAASHPSIPVSPLRPWADLCERWDEVLALIGLSKERISSVPHRGLRLEELHHRERWNKELPPAEYASDYSRHIPGWNLTSEWHPMSAVQPFAGKQTRCPAIWTLDHHGSIGAWAPRHFDDLAGRRHRGSKRDLPAPSSLGDVVSAARIVLSVRRGNRRLLTEATSPEGYLVFPEIDPASVLDGDRTLTTELTQQELYDWGIHPWGRDGQVDGWRRRSEVDETRATFIGMGPWEGRVTTVSLPCKADLSDLFQEPDVVRSALEALTAGPHETGLPPLAISPHQEPPDAKMWTEEDAREAAKDCAPDQEAPTQPIPEVTGHSRSWLGLAIAAALPVGVALALMFLAHASPTMPSHARYQTFFSIILAPPFLVCLIWYWLTTRSSQRSTQRTDGKASDDEDRFHGNAR